MPNLLAESDSSGEFMELAGDAKLNRERSVSVDQVGQNFNWLLRWDVLSDAMLAGPLYFPHYQHFWYSWDHVFFVHFIEDDFER